MSAGLVPGLPNFVRCDAMPGRAFGKLLTPLSTAKILFLLGFRSLDIVNMNGIYEGVSQSSYHRQEVLEQEP